MAKRLFLLFLFAGFVAGVTAQDPSAYDYSYVSDYDSYWDEGYWEDEQGDWDNKDKDWGDFENEAAYNLYSTTPPDCEKLVDNTIRING